MMVSSTPEKWQSLHPASVPVNLIPQAVQTLRSAWPLLIPLYLGTSAGVEGALNLGFLAWLFFLFFMRTLIHFFTLRYRVENGLLQIRSGLIYRKTRELAVSRIQNVERKQNMFHRLSGLVEIRIETASGEEVEGLLSALDRHAAQRLILALSNKESIPSAPATPIIRSTIGELLASGATHTRWSWIVVALIFLVEAPTYSPKLLTFTQSPRMFALLVATGILGTWIASTGFFVTKHYGFSMTLEQGSLRTIQGLITRRRMTLPQNKIQIVSVLRPVLFRIIKTSAIRILTAATQPEQAGAQRAQALIPLTTNDAVPSLIRQCLPSSQWREQDPLKGPAPIAIWLELLPAVGQACILIPVYFIWPSFGWLLLLLAPIIALDKWLDFRALGWHIGPCEIISQSGWRNRRIDIVPISKIQSTLVFQPLIAKWLGLAKLVVRVAGANLHLPYISSDDAIALQNRLTK
jgi:putative membrane protein